MTDQTVQVMRRIEEFAMENAAVVDRVKVALCERDGKLAVEFTAHLSPKPLPSATACLAYLVETDRK